MKFNTKSKKGFTLIELLVVIGILAVLAAIAIPSVAGLIDRANVSADNTNANEMTNAMERFVSEYELYKQDIASGALKDNNGDGVPDNMDAAQGRVYNVTKAITRADIEALESEAGFNGIRIDIDNKYAQNHATAKAVMQNYMKTSSSTFEPKQSDMTYWYNTVTGYTIVAGRDVNTATLQDLLPTEIRYDNSNPASITEWIDLSSNIVLPDIQITTVYAGAGVNDPTKKAIKFLYCFSNPKYSDINLYNLYTIANYYEECPVLDMSTCRKKVSLGERHTENNWSYINGCDDKLIEMSWGWTLPDERLNTPAIFRLCYQYEDNGQIKYAYTPYFITSYNELANQD